jgi:hypothetical protein
MIDLQLFNIFDLSPQPHSFFQSIASPKRPSFLAPSSIFSTKKAATIINAITTQGLTMYAIWLSSIRVFEVHAQLT